MNIFSFSGAKIIFAFLLTTLLAGCQPQTSAVLTIEPVKTLTQAILTASPQPDPILNPPAGGVISASSETTFSADNPLTDNEQIILYLEDLKDRFLAQFTKAGWYYFPQNGKDCYWVHFPENNLDRFDQFLTTRQNYASYAPDFVLPASILLEDGTWGYLSNPIPNSYQVVNAGDEPLQAPRLENLGDYSLGPGFGNTRLMEYIRRLKNPNYSEYDQVSQNRSFSFWMDTYEGQDVYVLLTQTTYSGDMKVIDNSTGRPINLDYTYSFFNMENGGLIAEKYSWVYENGEWNSEEDRLIFNLHLVFYYPELPPEIQTIYDQTAEKVRQYLRNNP